MSTREMCSSCREEVEVKKMELYEMKSGKILLLCKLCFNDFAIAEGIIKGTH